MLVEGVRTSGFKGFAGFAFLGLMISMLLLLSGYVGSDLDYRDLKRFVSDSRDLRWFVQDLFLSI